MPAPFDLLKEYGGQPYVGAMFERPTVMAWIDMCFVWDHRWSQI
jgi:hypothetical protein